jgi:hypothetical protein
MDTILSAEWWKFVERTALHSLDEQKLYRMFRADLNHLIPNEMRVAEIERHLPKWVYKVPQRRKNCSSDLVFFFGRFGELFMGTISASLTAPLKTR